MRPFSASRETARSSVTWLVSSVPRMRLRSHRVWKTILSITPRRYFWWIRGPDITPCSRRPSMRRVSAGVSKCCENLKDPKRHEMARYPIPQGAKLLEFYGFPRLFRPRHHVVDGGPD